MQHPLIKSTEYLRGSHGELHLRPPLTEDDLGGATGRVRQNFGIHGPV